MDNSGIPYLYNFALMQEDLDEEQLFGDQDVIDADPTNAESPALPFTYGSPIAKEQIFGGELNVRSTTFSPESSNQDSISNSSSENDGIGGNSRVVNSIENGTWTQRSFDSRADIDDSNRVMEDAFDFDTAASSPDADQTEFNQVARHVAIPASNSPESATSPSAMDISTRETSPFIQAVKPEHDQSQQRAMQKQPRQVMPQAANGMMPATIPQSSTFGYSTHSMQTPQVPWQQGHSQNMSPHNMAPRLWLDCPKNTCRVEIQNPIRLALWPCPPQIKKVHLQPYTISRPKFLAKPEHEPSPDTLELHATLFCASALQDEAKLDAAMDRAASTPLAQKRTTARKLSSNKLAETSDEESPLNGAEVWICDGCVNRERKRNDRKKMKKEEDERAWSQHEYQRIIVFNTSEIKDLEPFTLPTQKDDEQRYYQVPPPPPVDAMAIDLPMRIACYCRHQGEKDGFRVIFTLKDHAGQILCQTITPPINITDDHKTASKDAQWASHLQQASPGFLPINQRNAHSTTDLTRLQQRFSNPAAQNRGQFVNPQTFPQQASASHTPRTLSRQASPGPAGPASKKRKSTTNARLPESLQMTRLPQQSGFPSQAVVDPNGSYPATPVDAASPSHSLSGQLFGSRPGSMSYGHHNPHGFSSMHYASRSQSFEDIPNMQQRMYSAPSSAIPSRVPSPIINGQILDYNAPQQMLPGAFNQAFADPAPLMRPQITAAIIHNVLPRQGPKSGGIEVSIIGSGFVQNMNVKFGDALATTTTFWGEHALVCLLPPAKSAGKVPVTLQSGLLPGGLYYPLQMQGRTQKFEYIDDDETQLFKKALELIGSRQAGGAADAKAVARRFLEQTNQSSRNGSGSAQNGHYRHASGYGNSAVENLDTEAAVLKCLDLMDLTESPYPAQYELKGANGQTILHLAASLGYERLIAALLARGANPDARDKNGMSPMHMAALNDRLKIVRRLKLAGGDSTMRSLAGWTPADMASSHATYFAIRSVSPMRSSNFARPSSSQSVQSGMSFDSFAPRLRSREYHTTPEADDDSDHDSDNDSGLELSQISESQSTPRWAASRRGSSTEPLQTSLPSALDQSNHRYMQLAAAATAWRDQAIAQLQQMSFPPIPFADYQIQPDLMRRLAALRGSRPTSSDSKERMQTDSQHWWEFLTGITTTTSSPPAYDEIYPKTDSKLVDLKTASAARAALDAEGDIKFSGLHLEMAAKASSSTTIESKDENELLLHPSRNVKRLRSDRKLFFIWIPLLILVVCMMLKDRLPQAIALFRGSQQQCLATA